MVLAVFAKWCCGTHSDFISQDGCSEKCGSCLYSCQDESIFLHLESFFQLFLSEWVWVPESPLWDFGALSLPRPAESKTDFPSVMLGIILKLKSDRRKEWYPTFRSGGMHFHHPIPMSCPEWGSLIRWITQSNPLYWLVRDSKSSCRIWPGCEGGGILASAVLIMWCENLEEYKRPFFSKRWTGSWLGFSANKFMGPDWGWVLIWSVISQTWSFSSRS